mmetsp:Transcript_22728/g.33563  ORF Transcript_22728/g.33563 Transcript_22728/m.33563 type:complete len:401 (+) Transcript_22728:93-1295(+)
MMAVNTFFISTTLAVVVAFLNISSSNAHGYLKSPRARNFVAKQEGATWGRSDDVYLKEYCPHCLNHGGLCGSTGPQNYATPKSTSGKPMPADPQLIVPAASQITVEIVLTAHHKGHFEFKACPVSSTEDAPTQDCFDTYPLEMISDDLYGSVPDSAFPTRAYIPLNSYSNLQRDRESGGSLYRFTLLLPKDLSGDLVLLQWHYLTANSCTYQGYDQYPFPTDWGNMGYNAQKLCSLPLSADGRGLPEQFWNCAEIRLEGVGNTNNDESVNQQAPNQPDSAVVSEGTCGDGSIGNGLCPKAGECCSPHGYCGSSPEYCSTNQYCGYGYRNNGLCPNPNHCCSPYGYCGTTAAYCEGSPQYYPTWSSKLRNDDGSSSEISTNGNGLRRRATDHEGGGTNQGS